MADIATVTGIIGATTGAIALVVAIKSHIRVSAMKALDLRLEVARAFDNLDVVQSGLEEFLNHAQQSRHRVLNAIGLFKSGNRQAFDQEFEGDKIRLRAHIGTLPKRESSYSSYSPDQLEALLSTLHTCHVHLLDLRQKYEASLAEDDERRREIRAEYP